MIQLPENLDFLKDKNWIEDFLNQNSEEIFGQKFDVKIAEIERSKSFAPEVYNMLYKISLNGENRHLRASSSTLKERETTFKIMDYLHKTGFSSGKFVVPQALKFFPELNLMFYFDVPGKMMKDFIKDDKESFGLKVREAGLALRHFHEIEKPDFSLPQMDWAIDREKILKYSPDLKDIIDNKLEKNLEKAKSEADFCHGDYQSKNIIFGDRLAIIDFGASVFARKELDVACFLTQLEIMLKRYAGTVENFEFYKKEFIVGYGDFDRDLYDIYDYLFSFQIFQALTVIYEKDENADKNELLSSIDYWSKRIKEIYF